MVTEKNILEGVLRKIKCCCKGFSESPNLNGCNPRRKILSIGEHLAAGRRDLAADEARVFADEQFVLPPGGPDGLRQAAEEYMETKGMLAEEISKWCDVEGQIGDGFREISDIVQVEYLHLCIEIHLSHLKNKGFRSPDIEEAENEYECLLEASIGGDDTREREVNGSTQATDRPFGGLGFSGQGEVVITRYASEADWAFWHAEPGGGAGSFPRDQEEAEEVARVLSEAGVRFRTKIISIPDYIAWLNNTGQVNSEDARSKFAAL